MSGEVSERPQYFRPDLEVDDYVRMASFIGGQFREDRVGEWGDLFTYSDFFEELGQRDPEKLVELARVLASSQEENHKKAIAGYADVVAKFNQAAGIELFKSLLEDADPEVQSATYANVFNAIEAGSISLADVWELVDSAETRGIKPEN